MIASSKSLRKEIISELTGKLVKNAIRSKKKSWNNIKKANV